MPELSHILQHAQHERRVGRITAACMVAAIVFIVGILAIV